MLKYNRRVVIIDSENLIMTTDFVCFDFIVFIWRKRYILKR